jgi:uncharacterized membrane protein
MNLVAWILTGVAALAFVGSGAMKLATSREKLIANPNMGWAVDFSARQIKLIGLAELLGGVGLFLPRALDVAPFLSQVAAVCLLLVMVGAANVHRKRKERVFPPLVLGVLALAVFFIE